MTRLKPNDRLLLTAALKQGPASLRAWETWRGSSPLNDGIDDGGRRLIPLLHHNLTAQGMEGPEMSQYAAIRRAYWLRSQVFLRAAERLLSGFEDAGIDGVVLKGLGLALTVYPRPELRPMGDLDLLVSPADAPRAMALLQSAGFMFTILDRPANLWCVPEPFRSRHAHTFKRPGDVLEVDLHVRLHSPVPSLVLTQRMLSEAAPLKVGAALTSIARPTEQLFHVIIHASRANPKADSVLRWVADVAMLRAAHDDDIDWRALTELGYRYECLALLQGALDNVAELTGRPLPKTTVSVFRAPRPSRLDGLEWTARRWGLFNQGFPFGHVLDYRRFRRADLELGHPPRTFARFLADLWMLQDEREIPKAFLAKVIQRLLRRTPAARVYGSPALYQGVGSPDEGG